MNKRRIVCALVLVLAALAASGCSVTHKVTADAAEAWRKELLDSSDIVKNVRITFTRPNLTCHITMTEEPPPELIDSILASARTFATVDHMNEIAKSLKWGLDISEIRLTIDSDRDAKTIEHAYYARYFKTFDASDNSEANIEAYSIWYEDNH
ncbi:hypothetical protein [Paenibacillus contaminans]|uniref:DUF4825 domain-containing protein n=1 Tax=Paenibacillus contaminans TaxID=450362 RepID=A0A329MFT7_9BACL|nr:hypothetical protein [Paenibacillus contaminans]RAV18700.1 hypothetical protein DQG23_23445 [Paenibacillus contaminans]